MTEKRSKQVYVVDGNEAVRDSLLALLTSNGLSARTFTSGKEFLARAERLGRSCLILDLYMPELSGLELLRLLRARGNQIPVIAISGRRNPALDADVEHEGVLAILSKPFDEDDLLSLIAKALGPH
jgi:two-component system response regulator FixJ